MSAQESTLDKARVRAAMRRQRRQRAGSTPQQAQALAEHALTHPAMAAAHTIAAYAALPGEPDLEVLLSSLRQRAIRVLLPVVGEQGEPFALTDALRWALDSGPCSRQPGALGVAVPPGPRLPPSTLSQAQVVLLPALALDRQGNRLGQGAGWYDRSLCHADPHALLVGVIHPQELVDHLPTQPHDVPVHAALTAEGWHCLRPHEGVA